MTDLSLTHLARGMVAPFTDPQSRTWWVALAGGAVTAAGQHLVRGGALRAIPGALLPRAVWSNPSALADLQLLVVRRVGGLLLGGAGLVSATWLAVRVALSLDHTLGVPAVPALPEVVVVALCSAVWFVASDASRFVLHLALHRVDALWSFHQVHHTAEVLTPLTFHRLHPVEGVLYAVRGALVMGLVGGGTYWLFRDQAGPATLLGVSAVGLVLNVAFGNLRHSHVALGFGVAERWLMSPSQHQLHHARDMDGHGANFGTWLAVWDRMAGTWRPSHGVVPEAFGLDPAHRNHRPDDVLGMLVGPFAEIGRRLRPLLLAALGWGSVARGQEVAVEPADAEAATASEPPADPDFEDAMVVIVESRGEVPRVAGSAAVIDEAELDRYAYDDIHRVLARVPGVYVRGEDGFGLRPNIGIRGANSDRSAKVTLMEDGVLLAPAPYAAPAAYYFPMTARLTGVEVFLGPAATRFGPNTIGGAINLRTRAVPKEGEAALDVAAGMRSTVRLQGHAGYGTARGGFVVDGAHLGTGGFKQLDGGGPTGFERQEVMLKGRVAPVPGDHATHAFEVKFGVGREKSHETYLGLTMPDFEATPYRRYAASALDLMAWRRTQAELAWTVDAGDVTVRTVAYHHWLSRQWTKLNRFAAGPDLHDLLLAPDAGQAAVFTGILRGEQDSANDDQLLRIGTNDRRYHAFGVQSVLRWQASGGIVASQLEAGVRVHGDLVDRLHTEEAYAMTSGALIHAGKDTYTTLDAHSEALAVAAYAHEDLLIGPVRVLPGARVEVIRTMSEVVGEDALAPQWRAVGLPGLGLLADPRPWLQVFGGVHRGFSPVAPGQPMDVRPELSWNVEAGARASTEQTHATLVGFFNDYQNIVGACTFSSGCGEEQLDQQFNGGKAWVYGLEATVGHRQPLRGRVELGGELNYTFTGSRFRSDFDSAFPQFGDVSAGDALPYVPVHQGSLRLELLHPRFTVAVAGQARGAMRDIAGQGQISEAAHVPWGMTWDLSAEVHATEHVSAYGTITNFANTTVLESLRPFGARPAQPLQAMIGVRIR